jgi:hypothetical protein
MGKPAATDRPCLRSLSHSFTLDFVITGNSKEVLEDEVKPLVIAYLQPRGLELSEEKTRIRVAGKFVRKYTLSSNSFWSNSIQGNYAKFFTRCCGMPWG